MTAIVEKRGGKNRTRNLTKN